MFQPWSDSLRLATWVEENGDGGIVSASNAEVYTKIPVRPGRSDGRFEFP